ncbi:MAG: phosphatidate cytidylyltransferase [Candidatus Margulisbacteria bacterium]|nr:phosphatidate cytidylyltransferase [Candidatus Margulisiibacteriota bacterium]
MINSILATTAIIFTIGFAIISVFGRFDYLTIFRGELGKRYLSWLALVAIYLTTVFLASNLWIKIVLGLFILFALYEYGVNCKLERFYLLYLLVFTLLSFLIADHLPQLYPVLIPAFSLILAIVTIFRDRVDDLYKQVSYSSRIYLYIVWTLGHFCLYQYLNDARNWLVIIAFGVALSDVFAFVFGKAFGRHLIARGVNSRKAYEGIIGDLFGAGLAFWLFFYLVPVGFPFYKLIILWLIVGLGSVAGDLISSLHKRHLGIKDWGELIPGHGGVLDRVNSLIVVIPICFYFLKYF